MRYSGGRRGEGEVLARYRLFSGRLVKNYVAPMWTQALTGWYE